MKLSDLEYEIEDDYKVIKALKRTFKDACYVNETQAKYYKERKRNNLRLLNDCYASRKSHRAEGVFTNYFYWPSDIGLPFLITETRFIWVVRLCNIINKKDLPKMMHSSIRELVHKIVLTSFNNAQKKRCLTLLLDNKKEILTAFKKVGINKQACDAFFNILDYNNNFDGDSLPF
jgi:hypothetical protein